jgi:hypothetical protein
MFEQLIALSLVKIEFMSKMLLHCIISEYACTLNGINHVVKGGIKRIQLMTKTKAFHDHMANARL